MITRFLKDVFSTSFFTTKTFHHILHPLVTKKNFSTDFFKTVKCFWPPYMRVQNNFFKKCIWANKIEGTLFAMCLKRQVSHPLEVGHKKLCCHKCSFPHPVEVPVCFSNYCPYQNLLCVCAASYVNSKKFFATI